MYEAVTKGWSHEPNVDVDMCTHVTVCANDYLSTTRAHQI